jgi:pimeloyl-ACP methyl ester carboxylesterase
MRRLLKTLLGFAGVALGMYLAACAFLYFQQRHLLYFPVPARGHAAPVVALRASGPRVLVSTRELPGARAVVFFGGNAEDVSRTVPLLAQAFPGQALYLLHYRGYGGSEGAPTEDALVADALALFDQVHAKHAQVTVIGRSLGSGLATHVASERPVQRLVLVTPYDSIVTLASAQYPYFPISLLIKDRYDSYRYAPRVHAPTRIVAAGDDRIVPRYSTEALLRSFPPGVAQMTVLPGVGHNSVSEHTRYLEALSAP